MCSSTAMPPAVGVLAALSTLVRGLMAVVTSSDLRSHPDRYVLALTSPTTTSDQRFRWSALLWSPPPESNRRPHPYHESRTHRCADQRFCRSLATVTPQVMCSTWTGNLWSPSALYAELMLA